MLSARPSPPIRFWWVLDANVLYAASNEDPTALVLLLRIQLDDGLGLDHEHRIDHEYRGALDKHPAVSHWFHRMYVDGRCRRYPANLPPACLKRLRRLKFHDDDDKYVAVALQTAHRLLVTTNLKERHFGPAVCDYLRTTHGVDVMCPADACARARASATPGSSANPVAT
jgi:hypothetical protein